MLKGRILSQKYLYIKEEGHHKDVSQYCELAVLLKKYFLFICYGFM